MSIKAAIPGVSGVFFCSVVAEADADVLAMLDISRKKISMVKNKTRLYLVDYMLFNDTNGAATLVL